MKTKNHQVNKFLRNNIFIILILIAGLFFRIYNLEELFYYSHDNDLAGWFIKDVVIDHHPRLIGQETSTRGIFIGPLFYYLQIPFYLLTGLDPIGGTLLVALLSMCSVFSLYYVFSKIWNSKVGLIGASIYAFSFYTILVDREVVPTMPVMLWTIWYMYALWLLLKNNQKVGWPLVGILLGFIWHLNFALVLVTPLIVVSFILGRWDLSKQKKWLISYKPLLVGIFLTFVLSLPLFVFEYRHEFQQTNALISALTTDQKDVVEGTDKWERTFHLASKNVSGLVGLSVYPIKYEYVHVAFLALFLLLIYKKYIDKKLAIIMILWLMAFLVFFSSYSKILSEYYLNGMIVVYIAILAVTISSLWNSSKWKYISVFIVCVFILINFYRFFTITINKSGYIYRKAVVSDIKKDADTRGFPCVAISYITSPGNDLGYRYFIWRANLKTVPVSTHVPVYTIVFPLKPIFQEDRSFGAIGLIYPDYSRYNMDEIKMHCTGENSNLTDPMFGFTN